MSLNCAGTLLACCMFWGLQQILVKAIVHEVAPLFQASLRCIGACVLLMLWCRWRGVKLFERDGSLWAGLLAGALLVALGAAGAHVICIARTVGGLEELDDRIRAIGGEATLVPLDVTDGPGIDRLGQAMFERFGKLDRVQCGGQRALRGGNFADLVQ